MKKQFANQTQVKILPTAGLPSHITKGRVVGVYTMELPVIGCVYAVHVDGIISDAYLYPVVGVAAIHLEEIA